MALDGLGSDDIEVDGVMSRPSDPMLCKQKYVCVSAPIAFSVRKSFWKKFLGNGVRSVRSVRSHACGPVQRYEEASFWIPILRW